MEIKPGYAAYLTSREVNEEFIAATIIDLIIRGYINAPHTSKMYDDSKFDLLIKTEKSTDNLCDYEKYLLMFLFQGKKKQVESNDVGKLIVDSGFKLAMEQKVNFEICDSLSNGKPLSDQIFLDNVISTKNTRQHKRNRAIEIFIIELVAAFYFLCNSGGSKLLTYLLFTSEGLIISVIIAAFLFAIGWIIASVPLRYGINLDEGSKRIRDEYMNLYRMIKAMPLNEGRLFNEYISYAIAFELDEYWQKKFDF